MANLIDQQRAPYINELNEVIGKSESLLYRRGNFNGTWDDVICDSIIEQRDSEISLSPGFRWGTTLLPNQKITIEDIYSQTAINYPEVYRIKMTGKAIKELIRIYYRRYIFIFYIKPLTPIGTFKVNNFFLKFQYLSHHYQEMS